MAFSWFLLMMWLGANSICHTKTERQGLAPLALWLAVIGAVSANA